MISSLMIRVSLLILIVGMLAGIAMGMTQKFMLAPAHAHLNLIGGVMLFLFGLYYRLVPAAAATRLAKLQCTLHIIGALLFPIGIVIVLTAGPSQEIYPILGSLIVLAATVLFAIVVWGTARA